VVGIVTLTTVEYGDIVPDTTAGRAAGVAIMFTGIAVLGVLAGSLFGLQEAPEPAPTQDATPTTRAAQPIPEELAALQAQLRSIERRLGALADLTRTDLADRE
jgi:ion channel